MATCADHRYRWSILGVRFEVRDHPLLWYLFGAGVHETGHAVAFRLLHGPTLVRDNSCAADMGTLSPTWWMGWGAGPAVTWRTRVVAAAGPLADLAAFTGYAHFAVWLFSDGRLAFLLGLPVFLAARHYTLALGNMLPIPGHDGYAVLGKRVGSADSAQIGQDVSALACLVRETLGTTGVAHLNHANPVGLQGIARSAIERAVDQAHLGHSDPTEPVRSTVRWLRSMEHA